MSKAQVWGSVLTVINSNYKLSTNAQEPTKMNQSAFWFDLNLISSMSFGVLTCFADKWIFST